MGEEKSLSKLQEAILEALKSWYEANAETSPLGYLRLFQQARLNGAGSVREATNKLLLDALQELAVDYKIEADLLRKRFLDGQVMHAVANSLNFSEATAYRLQREAVSHLALILQTREKQAWAERRTVLESRLEPPTYTDLIGVEEHLDRLLELLASPRPPWLIAIEGLGGLGKTSMADAVSRRMIGGGPFFDFGWISARSNTFNAGGGIQPVQRPALTAEDLIEKLAAQLMPDLARASPFSIENTLDRLRNRLKERSHLIVIDNLETITDLQSLLPTLQNLVDPTKFILTSRQSLYHEPGLYHFELPPLSESDALGLIRHEAHLHNLPALARADDDTLRQVFNVVGGNPLALRLVVGQVHIHALDVILDDLTAARGRKAEMLYTFIYRRAWDSLDELTQKIFLAMPLVADQGGSPEFLAAITQLDPAALRDGLDQLVAMNLVNSSPTLRERRYTIHNLTRTFLQEQVARW